MSEELPERRINFKEELEEFKQILAIHIEHFKTHELEEKKNYCEILKVQQDTNEKLKGLLEAWEILTNSLKALALLGSVFKWITGIVIGLGSLWAIYNGNITLGK